MSTITLNQIQIQQPTSAPLMNTVRGTTRILIPQFPPRVNRTPSKPEKEWGQYGIGVAALILATIFGIGAWVGMNMQYNQGTKGLELSIWTTCADHEQIQTTDLCREVLGKSFDDIQPRSVESDTCSASILGVEKRAQLCDAEIQGRLARNGTSAPTHLEDNHSFQMVCVSLCRRLLLFYEKTIWPSIRYTVVCILHLLVIGLVEGIEMALLHCFCLALEEEMPSKISPDFPSDTAILVLISAFKSFWFCVPFWGVLIWTCIWRVVIRILQIKMTE